MSYTERLSNLAALLGEAETEKDPSQTTKKRS
jgi:hypothetical protein